MRSKLKTVVITGASGFIGKNLLTSLSKQEEIKIKASCRDKEKIPTELLHNPQIDWLEGDLKNEDFCRRLCENTTDVIHLAACKVNNSFHHKYPALILTENSIIDKNVISVCAKNKIKLIYISSVSAYLPKTGLINERDPVTEDIINSCSKINGYAISKRWGEELCKVYSIEHDLPITILRVDNVFGEEDNFNENAQLIPSLINEAINTKKIEIWGSGNQQRTFLYIKDAVDTIISFINENKSSSKLSIYNITSSEVLSINNVAKMIVEFLKIKGEEIKISYISPNNNVKELTDRIISNNKLRVDFPNLIFHSFKESLEKTITWFLKEKKRKNRSDAK